MNLESVDWPVVLDVLLDTFSWVIIVFAIGFVFGCGFLYAMKVVKP